ncbi:MAG TPA: nucleoside monophosphate kinase [Bacillota bacterium]|nr:nucleoside monophosphate kinase [Bacillota bacterium]
MSYRTILLFGAPGAGKGTQGKILASIPNFFHCSCGEVFRSLPGDSPLSQMFRDYSSRGHLVPDTPTLELWRSFIEASVRSGRFHPEQDTLVLDGIPRSVRQAEAMADVLKVVGIFYLRCADQESLIQRLQRRALKENRFDDANIEIIRQRQITYEQDTKPVLDFYDPKLLHYIDAGQTPVKVLFDIVGHLVNI